MTAQSALKLAQDYVSENRAGQHVKELLEDSRDYFVVLELDDPSQEFPVGPGAILISKSSGELRTEAWGNVIERVDTMSPVS